MTARSSMKIVFMHYHLKTGGVTTCLKNQVEALKNDCDVCVITGELSQTGFPAKTIHIPELAYTADYHRFFEPEKVAATVVQAIESCKKKAFHYFCKFTILPKMAGRSHIIPKTIRKTVITVLSTHAIIGSF